MNNAPDSTTSITSITSDRQMAAGIICLFLGLGLLTGVGFAGSDVIHNAAHDTRHAVGFPCH